MSTQVDISIAFKDHRALKYTAKRENLLKQVNNANAGVFSALKRTFYS